MASHLEKKIVILAFISPHYYMLFLLPVWEVCQHQGRHSLLPSPVRLPSEQVCLSLLQQPPASAHQKQAQDCWHQGTAGKCPLFENYAFLIGKKVVSWIRTSSVLAGFFQKYFTTWKRYKNYLIEISSINYLSRRIIFPHFTNNGKPWMSNFLNHKCPLC